MKRKIILFWGTAISLCAEFWPLQWQRSALRVWKEILNSIQVGTKSNYSISYLSPDFLLVFYIKCIRANILTISLLINWMCIKEPDIKGQTKTNHNVFFFIILFFGILVNCFIKTLSVRSFKNLSPGCEIRRQISINGMLRLLCSLSKIPSFYLSLTDLYNV